MMNWHCTDDHWAVSLSVGLIDEVSAEAEEIIAGRPE